MAVHCSGPIWRYSPRRRAQIVRRVCEALEGEYGCPRLGNPCRPVDDLVYIILSNKTTPATATEVYRSLKRRFPSWEHLLDARADTVRRLLRPAGLSAVKTRQIRAALRQVRRDFGAVSLAKLQGRSSPEAEEYLVSLPGVSHKVAKCVLMYTMGAAVLPVDAHVHRIATRLGWTARKRADQCHSELQALVAEHHRHAFHVGCVVHGRAVCRPTDPGCGTCCIQRHCKYPEPND